MHLLALRLKSLLANRVKPKTDTTLLAGTPLTNNSTIVPSKFGATSYMADTSLSNNDKQCRILQIEPPEVIWQIDVCPTAENSAIQIQAYPIMENDVILLPLEALQVSWQIYIYPTMDNNIKVQPPLSLQVSLQVYV